MDQKKIATRVTMKNQKISRSEFLRFVAKASLLAQPSLLGSCKTEQIASEAKLLKWGFDCAGNQERANSILPSVNNWFRGKSQNAHNTFALAASLLPDEYLQFLNKSQRDNGFYCEIADISAYGYCTWNGRGPTMIQLSPKGINKTTPMHEMGHAVHDYNDRRVDRTGGQLGARDALQRAFAAVSLGGESHTEGFDMWDYALKNVYEYFAVSFSSFYCSAAARSHMERAFPETWAYFNAVLLPAPDLLAFNPNGALGNTGQGKPILTNNAQTAQVVTNAVAQPPVNNPTSTVGTNPGDQESLAQLITLLMQYFYTQSGTGLVSVAKRAGIVRPNWQVLHADEPIFVEIGINGVTKTSKIKIELQSKFGKVVLDPDFEEDLLFKNNLTASITMPPWSELGNLKFQNVPIELRIVESGRVLARRDYTFEARHIDDDVLCLTNFCQ
jgi:hypothetical protein